MTILVTGCAGFIGSNFVHVWIGSGGESIVNLDKLTYAGNAANLDAFDGDERYRFVQGDIGDRELVDRLLAEHRPRAVINFAAESHVERSIRGPGDFVHTNVVGTFNLLESVRGFWQGLADDQSAAFRFLQISTDEVYGTLGPEDAPFREGDRYEPNSPYSASKAAGDHLARAWLQTYGLPVLTTNCCNNYGPFQYPEKLIPLVIHNALAGKRLPIYGDGRQVRDWLYVEDHCRAIMRVLEAGRIGETYNIGSWNEMTNLDVVSTICVMLDELQPRPDRQSYARQIAFVRDRPGHDRRYAIDARKIQSELGWRPLESFETGIRSTVNWYLANQEWVRSVARAHHRHWLETLHSEMATIERPRHGPLVLAAAQG